MFSLQQWKKWKSLPAFLSAAIYLYADTMGYKWPCVFNWLNVSYFLEKLINQVQSYFSHCLVPARTNGAQGDLPCHRHLQPAWLKIKMGICTKKIIIFFCLKHGTFAVLGQAAYASTYVDVYLCMGVQKYWKSLGYCGNWVAVHYM